MIPNSFAQELTKLRELAGLTQQQLARRSGAAPSSLNRWEKGGFIPKKDNAERLDVALGAEGELLAAWRRTHTGSGLPEWARDIDSIEHGACQLSTVTPSLVPGYLQCPEYARAVFRAGHPLASTEELDQLVDLRCSRLSQLQDLQVTAVFPVAAISGAPDSVRQQQIKHLLEWTATERVSVHLVPDGTALLVPSSPIIIFTLRSGERAVVSDHADGNVVYEDEAYDRIAALLTYALAASLPAAYSMDVLRNLI